MEWLYGLLIGSTFTALLMHLAHRGHQSETRKSDVPWEDTWPYQNEGYKVRANGMIEPKVTAPWSAENHITGVLAHLERGDSVGSLDDVPTNCSCDWAGDHRFDEAEPRVWYRTMKDPKCGVHKADDEWRRRQ